MPTNHRDEVAELLADYRRSREQLASVHRALLSITESASSPDGLVTASVDSAGTLSGLVINDVGPDIAASGTARIFAYIALIPTPTAFIS